MQQSERVRQASEQVAKLDPATEVGTVTLKVADLERAVTFYNNLIGLQTFEKDQNTAVLGAGDRTIVALEAVPGARRQPNNTTGLYHAAILLPDRHALAVKMAQIAAIRYPFGYSDHLVSEAFYLSDPDGNGLELYRDRPRSEWIFDGDKIRMASDPIDFDSFFAEIKDDSELADPAMPAGTKLGHMHLRVGDIATAEAFYHGILGFDIVAQLPGALFISSGGYHHHLGMNTWQSRVAPAPSRPSVGLREFSVSLPHRAELDRLIKQIEAAGVAVTRDGDSAVVLDPWQNRVKLVLKTALVRS